MSRELRDLEANVNRELRLLERLPAAQPSDGLVARLQTAVRDEAQRVGQRRRVLSIARYGVAAAATVAVAFGLGRVFEQSPQAQTALAAHIAPLSDPEQSLDDWLYAVDATQTQLATLVSEPWNNDAGGVWSNTYDDETWDDYVDILDDMLGDGV